MPRKSLIQKVFTNERNKNQRTVNFFWAANKTQI